MFFLGTKKNLCHFVDYFTHDSTMKGFHGIWSIRFIEPDTFAHFCNNNIKNKKKGAKLTYIHTLTDEERRMRKIK